MPRIGVTQAHTQKASAFTEPGSGPLHSQQKLGCHSGPWGLGLLAEGRPPSSFPAAPGLALEGLTLLKVLPSVLVPSLFQAGVWGVERNGQPSHPSLFRGHVRVSWG